LLQTAALARLQHYLWDADRLRIYFETRNGMIGADYSSKFSAWLAHGYALA
jgi:deoxyribodipyrimidine photo-lyase